LYTAVPELIQDEILSRTTAVESNHIFIIQKTDFGKNPHNFLHDTEICAEIIQPKYFIYGHKGTDWVQIDIAYKSSILPVFYNINFFLKIAYNFSTVCGLSAQLFFSA